MPRYSEEEIRGADGPALDRMASTLGLGPSALKHFGATKLYDVVAEKLWEPHYDIAQADAVFRQLRARGWTTHLDWYATDTRGTTVAFIATQYFECRWGLHEWDTQEALALLRCAVLAANTGEG